MQPWQCSLSCFFSVSVSLMQFKFRCGLNFLTKFPVDNSGSISAGGSIANSGSIAAGGSTAMVTVLLLSSAIIEVLGHISMSLEKMKQNEQQFEHGQGAHDRQETMTAAVRMMMMIAFITIKSSLVPLIEGLCAQI